MDRRHRWAHRVCRVVRGTRIVSNNSTMEKSVSTLEPAPGESSVERFPDPGDAQHRLRVVDIEPKAAKRTEKQVVALFTVSILGTILFLVAYVVAPDRDTIGVVKLANLLLGLGLGFAFFGGGAAAVQWA